MLDVLRRSTIDETGLTLPEQLERSQYVAVDKFLKTAGALWNRKAKRHLFVDNAKARIEDLLGTGEIVDKKKSFQKFYTPEPLAEKIMGFVKPYAKKGLRCLEPSSGRGALAAHLYAMCGHVTCVEIDDDDIRHLQLKVPSAECLRADFLQEVAPGRWPSFDLIVMNPPFSRGQDIKHILHAYGFLQRTGRLFSVMSAGARTSSTKQAMQLQELIERNGKVVCDFDHGEFKTSGTLVRTCLIQLRGPGAKR